MYQLDGQHVVTVEGLTPTETLNAVQREMINHFGSQCGFCTPGFVVTMTAFLENDHRYGCQDDETDNDSAIQTEDTKQHERDDGMLNVPADRFRQALTGNLCRCTGYVQILETGLAARNHVDSYLEDLYDESEMTAALSKAKKSSVQIESIDPERTRVGFLPKKVF